MVAREDCHDRTHTSQDRTPTCLTAPGTQAGGEPSWPGGSSPALTPASGRPSPRGRSWRRNSSFSSSSPGLTTSHTSHTLVELMTETLIYFQPRERQFYPKFWSASQLGEASQYIFVLLLITVVIAVYFIIQKT